MSEISTEQLLKVFDAMWHDEQKTLSRSNATGSELEECKKYADAIRAALQERDALKAEVERLTMCPSEIYAENRYRSDPVDKKRGRDGPPPYDS